MSIQRLLKRMVVDRLPHTQRLAVERMHARFYVRDEVNVLRALCNPAKASVDIGANRGTYALFISQFSRRVYCFEPIEEMCEVLRRRFRGCDVVIECCALGEHAGELELAIPFFGSVPFFTRSTFNRSGQEHEAARGGILVRRRVQVRRLDEWNLEDIGFIKIDVEGCELDVLRGATRTIERNRPVLYIEIEQRFHSDRRIAELVQLIMNLGYQKAYFVQHGQLRDMSCFDPARHQVNVESEGYVSNFAFLPSGVYPPAQSTSF